MGWFEIIDSMQDRRCESRAGVTDALTDMLFNTNTNDINSNAKPDYSGTLITFSAKWIFAALFIWLLAYISAAFPYLGTYSYTRSGGVMSEFGGGIRHMLLFKGQTAFIEYEVDSAPNSFGAIYLDIAPFPGHLRPWSDAVKRVQGKTTGVLEYKVAQTGVYTFHDGTGVEARRQNLRYSVTWGAR